MHERRFVNGWSDSVYLDTDVILARSKDDWLASRVDVETMAAPKPSVATGIEVQFVTEEPSSAT